MKTEMDDNTEVPEEVAQAPARAQDPISKSPYMAAFYEIKFSDHFTFRIPGNFVENHAEFATHFVDRRIDVSEMNDGEAHLVIHYLHTGQYQPLKPEASSPEEQITKSYATSLGVYAAAVEYGLEDLAVLASQELTKMGERGRPKRPEDS